MAQDIYLSEDIDRFLSNYLYLQSNDELNDKTKKEKNMENFVVSVARAILFEPSTNEVLAYATALSESAFTLAMQSQEIRGGIGNTLKFNYKNTRTLNISLTNVAFSKSFLPLNLGKMNANTPIAIANEQCMILSETGSGTLEKVPLGPVSYVYQNGIIETVQNVTHSTVVDLGVAHANEKVTAIYDYQDTIDNLTIDSSTPPNIVRLVMNVQIRSNETNGIVEWLQLDIPSFQIDGNYELSMTADGVSSETLTGMALSVNGQQCADGDVYGYIKYVPVAEASYAVSSIAAVPSPLSVKIGEQGIINVYGMRGNMYAPIMITDSCSYEMQTGSDADITVDENGIVSISSAATVSDTGTVIVSYSTGDVSYTDTVVVNVIE